MKKILIFILTGSIFWLNVSEINAKKALTKGEVTAIAATAAVVGLLLLTIAMYKITQSTPESRLMRLNIREIRIFVKENFQKLNFQNADIKKINALLTDHDIETFLEKITPVIEEYNKKTGSLNEVISKIKGIYAEDFSSWAGPLPKETLNSGIFEDLAYKLGLKIVPEKESMPLSEPLTVPTTLVTTDIPQIEYSQLVGSDEPITLTTPQPLESFYREAPPLTTYTATLETGTEVPSSEEFSDLP